MEEDWSGQVNSFKNSRPRGLEKLGVRLTDEERRRQALQFAGIGAVSMPAVQAIKDLITHGKVSPSVPLKRWLPAQIVGGAFVGGALPAIQHALARSNLDKARARIEGEKALAIAKPKEMAMAVQPKALPGKFPKLASFQSVADRLASFANSPEALAILAGTAAGLSGGRAVAGHSAAGLAPRGRKTRSEDVARRAAFIGAPLGSVALLALAKKKGLTEKALGGFARKFPKGMVTDPATEETLLKFLVPAGTAAAGGVAGGLATGGAVGAVQKMRGSPYKTVREKRAAQGGQDLRMKGAVPGGVTKPPTQDSKAFASKQLQMSSAEVGPVQPSRAGAKIEDIIPKYRPPTKIAASSKSAPYQQTRKGRRPIRVHNLLKKAGDVMDPMFTDPLVQYLRKQAQKDGPLEDNKEDLPRVEEAPELSSMPPEPTTRMESGVKGTHAETRTNFDNTEGIRAKGSEKEFSYDPGVVDRILGL